MIDDDKYKNIKYNSFIIYYWLHVITFRGLESSNMDKNLDNKNNNHSNLSYLHIGWCKICYKYNTLITRYGFWEKISQW